MPETHAATSSAALDLYLLLDQSTAMSTMVNGETKWQAATDAITSFAKQPGPGSVSLGVQYYGVPNPTPVCPCMTSNDCQAGDFCFSGQCHFCKLMTPPDSCNLNDYAKPDVEIALLPAGAGAIGNSLSLHGPVTGPAMGPALDGAVKHAHAWAQSNPGHSVVAVLVAGTPAAECDPMDATGLAQEAALGLSGTPSIKTYAIGIFSDADIPAGPDALDAIAQAGGTGLAVNVMTAQPLQPQVLAALTSIRAATIGCPYDIPTPTMGTFDKNKVNVVYTPGGGKAGLVPRYQDKAHCPPNGDGWYYDSNINPMQIELCAQACAKVSADPTGTVDILLGCTSQVGM
jgi:hypothetical protein